MQPISFNRHQEAFIDIFYLPLELVLGAVALMSLFYVIKAARSSAKANELRTVPTLTLKYTKSTGRLAIINLSENIAYNIRIRPMYFRNRLSASVYKVFFSLPDKNYINANEEIALEERRLKDGGIEENESFAKVVANVSHDPLYIEFRDIQGLRYYTLINFNEGSEAIIQGPTKINIYRKFLIYLKHKKALMRYNRFANTKLDRDYPEKSK